MTTAGRSFARAENVAPWALALTWGSTRAHLTRENYFPNNVDNRKTLFHVNGEMKNTNNAYSPRLSDRAEDRIFTALRAAGFHLNQAMHEEIYVGVFNADFSEKTALAEVHALIVRRTGGRTTAELTREVVEAGIEAGIA